VKKYLPGILNEKQKSAKINNILTKLTRRGIIKNFGNDRNSLWKFLQNK